MLEAAVAPASCRAQFDQLMVPCFAPHPVVPVRGSGSRLWDEAGRDYVDFIGGIATNALGHCHPRLQQALTTQASQLWHSSNYFTSLPALRLARQLVDLTFAERVFFANSGAEANEAALKLARRYAQDHHGDDKVQIIACLQAFHGRTFFTVSTGGQPQYADGFGPKPAAIDHVPFNDLEALRALISSRTCAVIVEPIQGEGGVTPASHDYLEGVRALCDQHQALLIFDEVQTGNGRTGDLFAYMGYGVVPDILTTAKGLGGGFPIGAMLTTAQVAASFKPGTHGTTFGGNPLACAVASALLDEVSQPELLAGVRRREQLLREHLGRINSRFGLFAEVRGKGCLLGAVLADRWQGRARELLDAAVGEGVMVLMAGPNVLRLAPALNIPQGDIDDGMARLERAIARLAG